MRNIAAFFIKYAPIIVVGLLIIFDTVIPNSHWFEVSRVQVMDSTAGLSPTVIVARNISRPFRGSWVVTVKKIQDGTNFNSRNCSSSGINDYRPETILPSNIDLNWFTFPVDCDLQTGNYIVDVTWKFHVLFFERTVRAVSNVFVIK